MPDRKHHIAVKMKSLSSAVKPWTVDVSDLMPTTSFFPKPKISKQSALAVSHYLRDNQHQSPGRPGYALA